MRHSIMHILHAIMDITHDLMATLHDIMTMGLSNNLNESSKYNKVVSHYMP